MIPSEENIAEQYLLNFFVSKKWRVVRHIGMVVILGIVLYPPEDLNAENLKMFGVKEPKVVLAIIYKALIAGYVIALTAIYVNLFVLIPKFLLKNKFIAYLISSIVLVVIKYSFELVVTNIVKPYLPKDFTLVEFSIKSFLESATIAFIFLIATAGYKIFKKWVYESRQLAEMKEAKLKEELINLKNQINPHFLFNTLNNLNTLITTNTSKASAVVLGLSDVLRFYLYEADKDRVLLKKDIDILSQVLELEKIRRDDFQFSLTTDSNISGLMIPPFIFTNFVENAIKHSINNNSFSFVNIHFGVLGKYLIFTCENSTPPLKVINKYGGLGLQNVQRRLELMYGKNFVLDMNEGENKYSVKLKLLI